MDIDEQHEWVDPLESWEEVQAVLAEDWSQIRDARQRLQLERVGNELHVLEVDRRLRAGQRRALHRLGFRPVNGPGVTLWHWEVQAALRSVDLIEFSSPLEHIFEHGDVVLRRASLDVLRTRLAIQHLLSEQAQQVLRVAFRSQPADLAVAVIVEQNLWDDDEPWWAEPTG